MNVHQRSVRLAASFVVAVLAGCAPVAPTTVPTEGSPASSTGAPTGGPPFELESTDTALPAGRYTYSGFRPRVTIELDGTWAALNLLEGFLNVGHVTELDDVTIVQFALAEGVFTGPDSSTPTRVTAADAVTAIQANSSLRVIETSASRIGGLDGAQVTVETATDTSDRPVLMASSGPVVVESDRRLWIALFDTSDGLLAVMVSGTVKKWDEALAAAEPVLESVTIGAVE